MKLDWNDMSQVMRIIEVYLKYPGWGMRNVFVCHGEKD